MLFTQFVVCFTVLICIGVSYAASVINYKDGGVYTGDVVENRREGYGEMKYSTGDTYTGFWRNDIINGRGKIVYANGNWYDGDWLNGRQHGGGTKVWATAGTKYSGEWVDDKIQGICTQSFSIFIYYVFIATGQGWYRYPNGELYEGQWWNNMRHGRGEMKDKDHNVIDSGVWELNVKKYN